MRTPSVQAAKPSTPRLALEGLARLTDAIRELAKERRQNILVEEAQLREQMRIQTETIEAGRSKLEDLNRVHRTWADKFPTAQKAHGRALALRTKAKESGAILVEHDDGTHHNSDASREESLWDDTLVLAHMNLEFVTNRLSKLRESIAAEEMTVGANEVKFIAVQEDTKKKNKMLKSEIAKMDALIDFLNHPDFFKGR
ncbi:hypothetical protein KC19_VG165100 [Ceratodon purpureus]|uniref:Uncharacterized protein n=1 Tax=Ceratodon purpureus TaxID=3225 RepID=A0A8T0HRC7_CERPU|nr:hypothetical protein KC19_VG165100 [Ceratodon purpureus]